MPEKGFPVPFHFTNSILSHLPVEAVDRLHLRRVRLPAGRHIEFPGSAIESLFFLEAGVALMTNTFNDGSQVEVGLFGHESVLGVSALMGTKRSLNRVYMLLDGYGFATPAAAAKAEFSRCAEFQHLALRSVQAQLSQIAQSAGCNAKHDVGQRLARWLLLCVDRAGTNHLAMSHEALATMLGVRRMSAGVAVGRFKELGLLDHHRGNIVVLSASGLQEQACECYAAVRHHLDSFNEFDSGYSVPAS